MYGYVYLTTNLINNKIYIGQHRSEVFEPENYIGSGVILTNAIEKYGKQNFKNELLCECFTQEELNEKEKYYIEIYNATDKTIGYNIKFGGNATPCPDETKEKISKANSGKYVGHVHIIKDNIEKHIPKELLADYTADGWVRGRLDTAKQNLSKGYNYDSKGMLGKKQSEKQRIAASKACSYKRSAEQKKHFSESKKIPNKFICLRTPDNKSTIRCLIENKEKYLSLGYTVCNNSSK